MSRRAPNPPLNRQRNESAFSFANWLPAVNWRRGAVTTRLQYLHASEVLLDDAEFEN